MLIKNSKSNILHVGGKTLGPGTNAVDVAWWKETRKHPTIKAKLESGELTEETDLEEMAQAEALGETTDQTVVDHITTLSVNHAKQLVADTVDVKLLKAWLEKDERKSVKTMLEKQIEEVTAPPQLRDRTEKRQISTGRGPDVVTLDAAPSSRDD